MAALLPPLTREVCGVFGVVSFIAHDAARWRLVADPAATAARLERLASLLAPTPVVDLRRR